MKLYAWLQSAGVAALVLFPFYRSLLDRVDDLHMHAPVSVTILALSLVANLVLVSLVSVVVGTWLRSTSGWAWVRFLVPAFVLASLAEMVHIASTGWESTRLWLIVLTVITLLTLLLYWRWRRGEKLLVQLAGAVLIGVGFFCVFAVVQLLHLAMWHQAPNSTSESTTETMSRPDRPRVVWILFDELSYQQVFGSRYPNLELPNFDDLRKSSTLFTDMQPVADSTEVAIPSILLGQAIVNENFTTRNKLRVGTETDPLHPFNAGRTPFALARQYGLTTGVVGWYNPYCGILAPYLNQCYWADELLMPAVSAQKIFWQSLLRPWVLYGTIFIHFRQMFSENYRKFLVEDFMLPTGSTMILNAEDRIYIYQDLMRHATRMLEPSGPDFVFLHLPLPHTPGFYNRKTSQFNTFGDGSYIDNLALTDKTLGQFLDILRQSPRWKDTSVIVCGDHSWRVYLSTGSKYWTPEDEAASHGGVFDSRPMLMVHLAGQTTPATVSEPFPLLKVHDILNDLAAGKPSTFPSH